MNRSSSILVRILFLTLLFPALCAHAQVDTTQMVNPDSKNSIHQQKKPYVILISADGFRHDYAEKYQATNLLAFAKKGIRAESMIPGFPSVTFPNHYSIATGLYPAHHGLVNNSFYDREKDDRYSMGAKDKVRDGSWYGGTPIWVLAEQQQMIAANMFWVGSEAAIQGVRSTYSYNFTEQIPVSRRIQAVKDWLSMPEERRPHLITFYVSEPDHAGHSYGPDAPQTERAVKMVDSIILALTQAVQQTGLPVNYIFLSDHGMTAVDRENPIPLPKSIDPEKFIIPSSGTMVDIHAKNKADIQPLYQTLKREATDYDVYLKEEVPAYLHYSASDDRMNRIGDILLLPHWPKVFSNRKPGAGYHGFDPYKVKEMQATFIAWGPAFKQNKTIPSFDNVHVYPLIAHILGLQVTHEIDGSLSPLKTILK